MTKKINKAEKNTAPQDPPRRLRMLSIAGTLHNLRKRIAPGTLNIESELGWRWDEIMGELARTLSFVKLIKKNAGTHTLMVEVPASAFATNAHFMQKSIIDKVNAHFGFALVDDLKISHLAQLPKVKKEAERQAYKIAGAREEELR